MVTEPTPIPARQRILNVATTLFHHRGIAATAVDEILQASSTGKGQFYHYFEGKRAVVDAVAEMHATAKIEHLRRHLSAADGAQGIHHWLIDVRDTSIQNGLVGGCPIASMAAEIGETDPILREKLAMAFDGQLALLAEALRAERACGGLSPDCDPDAIAMRILTSVQGGLLLASTMKEPALLEEAVNAADRELAAATRQT